MTSRALDPNQIASSEAIRNVNRRIVLNRTRHPISRADLARVSGMQRSTFSLIVEELIREDWVIEGPTGRLPRGRRPVFLHLNEDPWKLKMRPTPAFSPPPGLTAWTIAEILL